MRHTLKASFAHRSDARHALDALLASGYPDAGLTEWSMSTTVQADHARADSDEAHHFGGPVRQLATKLFGPRLQNHEAAISVASMGDRHIVELTADSKPDAMRAIAIIKCFKPVDMEEFEDEPLSRGGARLASAATANGQTGPAYPPGTEPGALQYRAHEDSRYFGTQRADAPPAGSTFEETMGAASQWGDPGHGMLHVPIVSSGADPGHFQGANSAAYRYGVEMHGSDRYRNRSWDEAEAGLKSGWEQQASDNPGWLASKSDVRRGWDEVTPEIDDDSYYRSHWTTRYANGDGDDNYDDYKPAYTYGSEARRSEKFRSRDWRTVEPHLKADWEVRHPGRRSSWDNFKDAVKHGWHGISPDMDGADDAQQAYEAEARNARGDDSQAALDRQGRKATPTIGARNRNSDDVEVISDEKSEGRHAGSAPVWNRIKAAVRHGWDRVMS